MYFGQCLRAHIIYPALAAASECDSSVRHGVCGVWKAFYGMLFIVIYSMAFQERFPLCGGRKQAFSLFFFNNECHLLRCGS